MGIQMRRELPLPTGEKKIKDSCDSICDMHKCTDEKYDTDTQYIIIYVKVLANHFCIRFLPDTLAYFPSPPWPQSIFPPSKRQFHAAGGSTEFE